MSSIPLQNKLLATVGQYNPALATIAWPHELLEDEKVDGFTAPFNLKISLAEAFATFGLWHSSNGLMLAGIKHSSVSRGNATAFTTHPVLVGDYLDDQPIIMAENSYNNLTQLWQVKYSVATPPTQLDITPLEYRYFTALLNSKKAMADATTALADDLINKVLVACVAGANPIVVVPALPLLAIAKADFDAKIEQALKNEEQLTWHF